MLPNDSAVLCSALLQPHGQCYLWESGLIGLHAVSDGLIALAYYSIPLILAYFLRNRKDIPFSLIIWMFAGFILACGTTHLLEVWTIWHPDYWVAGWVKAITAVLSVSTAVALFRIVPKVKVLPSPDSLQRLNEELEGRVRVRTTDLVSANQRLEQEGQQREQAEAEVRRLNDSLQQRVMELQALLDLLPVGIGIANDPDCRDIRTNQAFAEMLGIASRQNASLSAPPIEIPSNFKVLQGERQLRPDELPMQRAAKENVPILDFQETIVREDGQTIQVLINAVPLRDADGRACGSVATVRDITAQKMEAQERLEFERRLQETQKLESLGVLAGGIAHDFNNILTGILGNASLARLELPAGYAPIRSALDNLEQAALRAGDLCKQMLAYAGKGRFMVQPLNLSRLVRETTELLEVSISKKAVIQFQLAEGLPAFQGDATQIRQVLMNLVINASEAIGDRHGAISIQTGRVRATRDYLGKMAFPENVGEGDYLYLEVSDTGCGMDEKTLQRIFDPFFTTKFTGRGLGLAAVLGIVRGHKGGIKVTSERGKGTTFRLLLPAIDQPATPPAPLVQAGAAKRLTGSVLIVEDEATVRTVAAQILKKAGMEVSTANDGLEAVDGFRRRAGQFSLVLMDLTMPNMDGEEAFRVLRGIEPSVRVVLMSGFNEQDAVNRFVGHGIAGFLSKPFTAEMLLTKIREVLPDSD